MEKLKELAGKIEELATLGEEEGLDRTTFGELSLLVANLQDAIAQQQGAKPMAVLFKDGNVWTRQQINDEKTFEICCIAETPLYTHPASAQESQVKGCQQRMPAGE